VLGMPLIGTIAWYESNWKMVKSRIDCRNGVRGVMSWF
jgi:hypothetical protein